MRLPPSQAERDEKSAPPQGGSAPSWQVLEGDALTRLRELPDESVQTCITSPPYFGLRHYGTEGQIGVEPTPDEYVTRLVEVFREVRRVLRDDGVLFLNLGDSYAGAQRGGAYGKGDTAPEGSQGRGCPCESLCGACRTAYRFGKAHSDGRPAPTPVPSPSDPTLAHTGAPLDRLPTSGSALPDGHSAVATQDHQPGVQRDDEQPLASQESTPDGSSPQRQDQSHLSDMPSACRLCGRSLGADAQASARTSACTCDTSAIPPSSADRSSDREPSDGAYPHSTITDRPKAKDLLGVPWRVAFALQADGWYLRSEIIWAKKNCMPESVTDRPTRSHEQVFLLSKSARYFFDQDAVREEMAPASEARYGYFFGGAKAEALAADGHIGSQRTVPIGDREPTAGRNIRSVWTVATQPYPDAHFATFPPKLVEPMVLAGSAKDDTVLDPFAGAGTTGLVALRHDRSFIGVELNADYCELARSRIRDDAPLMNVPAEAAA